MKYALLWGLSLFICVGCREHSTAVEEVVDDIAQSLANMPELTVQEIEPKNGYSRQFEVYMRQPLDHQNPGGAFFEQRIFISHRSNESPVIFMPSGYSSSPVKVSELSDVLEANQVYAAHRFMTGARPAEMDWTCLTIEQASADFHRIVSLLKSVYNGPWISCGVSKNGQAALFHRYFFPEDVQATVAVGSPLSRGTEDPRYEVFLEQAGSAVARERIRMFQRRALTLYDEITPYIETYTRFSDFSFTRMDAGAILEFEILEFPFSFWQTSDGDYTTIPDSTASALQCYLYLKEFGYFDFYSDELLQYYEPVYYQAYTELGWYRLVNDHLTDLLRSDPPLTYRRMAPQNVTLNYNPDALEAVRQGLLRQGNNIIYIYGAKDPWTAGAIESVGSTNSLKIMQQGANHNLRIAELDQRALIYSKLESWTGVHIN